MTTTMEAPSAATALDLDAAAIEGHTLSSREAALLRTNKSLVDQGRTVRQAHDAWVEAKETLTRRRKLYEEEQERLTEMVEEMDSIVTGQPRQLRLPTHSLADGNGEQPASTSPATGQPAAAPAVAASHDTFLSASELGLTENQVQKVATLRLAEQPVMTVSQLEDYIDLHGVHWYEDCDGIGKAAARKIEEKLAAWRADHPRFDDDDEADEPTAADDIDDEDDEDFDDEGDDGEPAEALDPE